MQSESIHQAITFAQRNKERFLSELGDFISIPSISTKAEHKSDIEQCAEWICNHLRSIGMARVEIFSTRGNPVVYAEWSDQHEKPTILFYGHYDVQPVEPLELWASPPFEAAVRENRIYGRGATDDKGQVFINFKALEACLKTVGKLPVNVKMIIEGEEEVGSGHLVGFVADHKDLLKSDLALISDTPFFAEEVPSICYGLRGIAYLQVDLVGPNRDLHSGSYGGAVHNPIQALSEIIAKLHDDDGQITIPGFYDDVRPPTKQERALYKKFRWSNGRYAEELGVKQLYGEKGFSTLERLWARPTLECNGICGGYTGEGVKSVIPSTASAKISMRLVPDQRPEKIAALFEKHIKRIAPKTVRASVRCLATGDPAITPIDSPGIKAASVALEKAFGKKPLFQREGGSIPIISHFKDALGVDTVLLGFGLPDENAHAPNEFLNLDNFFGGINTIIHFYNELPRSLSK
jgi:acetylornithine deacetylase/succinyl-diaminopimelate desuccinylase-like protein